MVEGRSHVNVNDLAEPLAVLLDEMEQEFTAVRHNMPNEDGT